MHPDADDDVRSAEVDPRDTSDFACALAARKQLSPATQRFAVLVIHLDRFTHASEMLGAHLAGRLRAQAVARVAALAPPAEMTWLGQADIGAAVPLPLAAADYMEAALRLARGVAAGFARPFLQDGFELFLSSSVGVALDDPDKPAERSLREAYDAMLRVRKRGGDGVAASAATTSQPLSTPLLAALPHALARSQLALNLQARASLSTGCVTGYTARLRWQSPEFGRVAPQDFLPALESLGMMGDVARWLMENALPLLNCPGIGEPVELSLLVSSAQMHGTPMIDTLLRTLERRHLDPARICLEIPPGALLATDHVAAAKLATLRRAGVRFALSDFADAPGGSATLERLRPDLLTFNARCIGTTAQPNQESAGAARLQSACEQAQRLALPVCAKGIETRHQLAEVRNWGCSAVQGYLLAQPFPARWLAQTHAAICARARELLA
ncbi:EAL domain-containing protein [Cupriavidus basilensis]|uniref:EAL domain-containing protein n=1 Tax=Cupriavidus basilensis TaxID=68895 RepID=UPI0023E7807E|nr:EAL domain-containing protein [Cupriavidus basilensis]MDF3886004.1 EAL domain-containing protein [Cupriavidus basilensis]